MTTATLDNFENAAADEVIAYRSIHPGAVAGFVLGLFSIVTVFAALGSLNASLMVAPVPVLGITLSLRSLSKIRRDPLAYTGERVAVAGAVLSLIFLVTGVGYGAYVHVTEVPPDHTRISFTELRPDDVQQNAGIVVPPEVMALNGQRVFIKGYMRPGNVSAGIDQFLLVRDDNQCCFGDISAVKYYDRILVNLTGKLRLNYSTDVFAIGGVLKVIPQNVVLGPQASVFVLQADHAK
jgi:hypothetical protein